MSRFGPQVFALALVAAAFSASPAQPSPSASPSSSTPKAVPGPTGLFPLSGLVEEKANLPLAGASVELLRVPSNYQHLRARLEGVEAQPVATATTDAQGRYLLQAPQVGIYKLRLQAPGRATMEFPLLAVQGAVEMPPVWMEPDEGAVVEMAFGNGAPVVGAWIHTRSSSRSTIPKLREETQVNGWRLRAGASVTGADGRSVLARRPGEWLDFTLYPPGALTPKRAQGLESLSWQVEPEVAWRRETQIEVLEPAADGHLQAVAEAVVVVTEESRPLGLTDGEGHLTIQGQSQERTGLRVFTRDGRVGDTWLSPGQTASRIVLPPLENLRGRVVAADTEPNPLKPLAKALVWPSQDPGRFVLADAQGRFQLGAAGPVETWVQAHAPGYLPQRFALGSSSGATGLAALPTAPLIATTERDLLLAPAAEVLANVVGDEGEPLADVQALALIESPRAFFQLDKPESRGAPLAPGQLLLPRLRQTAIYELWLKKSGYETVKAELVLPRDAGRSLKFTLRAKKAAFGRILGTEGEPLARARIEAFPATDTLEIDPAELPTDLGTHPAISELHWGQTDTSGFFSLGELPASRVHLRATRPGFAPLIVRGIEVPTQAGAVDLGVLVMVSGANLRGKLTDPAGLPVAGARLRAWEARRGQRPGLAAPPVYAVATTSDEKGLFAFSELVPGRRIELLVEHGRFVAKNVAGVVVDPAAPPLEIELLPAASVVGRLVGPDGEGVVGARVEIRPSSSGKLGERQTVEAEEWVSTSGEGGVFEAVGLPAGTWEIEASSRVFRSADSFRFQLADGETKKGLEVPMVAGAVLSGFVTRADGRPVPEATVLAANSYTRTTAAGRYELVGLAAGVARLEVRHPAHRTLEKQIEVSEGENEVDLRFAAGQTLRGQVVDAGRSPVPGAQLTLQGDGGQRYHRRSDPFGRFEIEEAALGTYAVDATKDGFSALRLEAAVRVTSELPPPDLEIVLPPGAAVGGLIRGIELEDLARVQVTAEGRRISLSGQVDHQGRYRVEGLAAGPWRLRASFGERETSEWVTLEPGDEKIKDLDLAGGLTLSGRITLGGRPLAQTLVALRGRSARTQRQVTSRADGTYAVEGIEPGEYRLEISHAREQVVRSQELTLDRDRQVDFDIEVLQVRGRVTAADSEQPIANAVVVFEEQATGKAGGSRFTVGTDAEGAFFQDRLAPGSYTLRVEKDGYAPLEEALELQGDLASLDKQLQPTAGLVLQLMSPGSTPSHATVGILSSDGKLLALEDRPVEGGQVLLPRVPPGRWHLWVRAPQTTWSEVVADAPGEPVAVSLQPGADLRVRVPAMLEQDLGGTLVLGASSGQRWAQFDATAGRLREEWPILDGEASLEALPPGQYAVEVVAETGTTWKGQVQMTPFGSVELVLD